MMLKGQLGLLLFHNITVFTGPVNTALVSIKYFFQTHEKNLTDSKI